MARATAVGALALFGGTYPPGHDATSFGGFVAPADAIVDIEALPGTLSTTGTNEIVIGDRILYNLVIHSMWASAGGDLTGKPEPVVLTQALKDDISQLTVAGTDEGTAVYVKMQAEF